jgi:hypothetical protein
MKNRGDPVVGEMPMALSQKNTRGNAFARSRCVSFSNEAANGH